MGTLIRSVVVASLLVGCGDLQGFSGDVPPLVTVQVATSGDFEAARTPGATDEDLRVALVWSTQWLPEPLCFLPPENAEVAATIAAGCRDPLSFTPTRVTATVPITADGSASFSLFELPSAEVMFGDVTARVAYGSIVVFDDRDHNGTLELARARRTPTGGFDDQPEQNTNDVVYGASFVSMQQADTRLAFREGDFIETGFYPRHGCGAPLPAFSLLSAGGFSVADAAAATVANMLPSQDPATCAEAEPESTTVTIPFRPSAEVREVGCEQRRLDSRVRYRQPPDEAPDLEGRTYACAKIPTFSEPAETDGVIQLIVATRPDETCKGITHYTLLGCDEGALTCDAPEWDFRATPPAWWPCPTEAP